MIGTGIVNADLLFHMRPDAIISEARSLPIVDSHRDIVELMEAGLAGRAKTRLARILRLDERYLFDLLTQANAHTTQPMQGRRS